MGDHTAIEQHESLPFESMYRPQRSGRDTYQHSSVEGMGHFEETSNVMCDSAGNGYGTSINGLGEQVNADYWENETPCSSHAVNLTRGKTQNETFDVTWASHCHQQGALGNYGASGGTGDQQQKLDSFTDAFYRRNASRIRAGENGGIFGVGASPKGAGGGFEGVLDASSTLPSISVPLVLSPPPTPLPAPPISPPRRVPQLSAAQIMNHAQSQMQMDGPVQFFPSLPCTSSALQGKFPHSHWFPLSGDQSGDGDSTSPLHQPRASNSNLSNLVFQEEMGFHLRHANSPQRNDYGNTECSLQNSLASTLVQYPQSSAKPQLDHDPVTPTDQLTWSQMGQSSLTFCPSSVQTYTHTEGQRPGETPKPFLGSQLMLNKFLCYSKSQGIPPAVYTGVPFRSVVQTGRDVVEESWGGMAPRYTPRPMLNPHRSGTGLFCNVLGPFVRDNRVSWSTEREDTSQSKCVNIGPEFQAVLPDLEGREESEAWLEEPLREELLWKPWEDLEESSSLQEQVENLLDLSASSALPGGGANLELALHCLSRCQGDMLATLEMLLFSDPSPSGDYHYSGSDVWLPAERKLFHTAFSTYGKDFSLIQRMVKTKQVSQCVEFYYHSKKLSEKQSRQREREREQRMETEMSVASENRASLPSKMVMNPIGLDGMMRPSSLATSFPCKQCGKMFYKIKSRNAHMKIHRQQQDDWRERNHLSNHGPAQTHQNHNHTGALCHQNQLFTHTHQNQILTQSLIQNLVQSQARLALLQSTKTQNGGVATVTAGHNPSPVLNAIPKSSPLPLYTGPQQTWDAFQVTSDPAALYFDTEAKAAVGITGEGKGQVQWQ